MISLSVNGKAYEVDVEPDTPLLWVLRDTIGLTGTRYGCGIAQCGACTVHIDGAPVRSCSIPIGSMPAGKSITTIEGLAQDDALHPVQQAWVDHDVPQCGYCQSGMIMAVAALLEEKPKPTDADIDAAITNICRCGSYQRVRAAIHAAAHASGRRPVRDRGCDRSNPCCSSSPLPPRSGRPLHRPPTRWTFSSCSQPTCRAASTIRNSSCS